MFNVVLILVISVAFQELPVFLVFVVGFPEYLKLLAVFPSVFLRIFLLDSSKKYFIHLWTVNE